jgi:hypothetical protein
VKVVICEVYEIEAASVDEGVAQAQSNAATRDSAVYGAATLDVLPHPIHLQVVQDKVGYIAPSPVDHDTEPAADVIDAPPSDGSGQ